MSGPERKYLQTWALETGLALLTAWLVYWLWPRLHVARLGREEIWFALGWLVILAGPSLLRLFNERTDEDRPEISLAETFEARACEMGAFCMALAFVFLLATGQAIGNYKLWLGGAYLAGITLRLGGMALKLRERMLRKPEQVWQTSLLAAGLAAMAGLVFIPWVRPDLSAQWPPPARAALTAILHALLWGGISGAVFAVFHRLGSLRPAWLALLAAALGPGPALALTWFQTWPLVAAFCILAGLGLAARMYRKKWPRQTTENKPLSLYWLLRALVVIWWGAGAAVSLACAWWYPSPGLIFTESAWLRALLLGAGLVVCLGILAEYSLPLLGRSELGGSGGKAKLLGVLFSSLALLASLAPLVVSKPLTYPAPPTAYMQRARSELVNTPITLDAAHPEVVFKPPSWLKGLSHVFVVGYLTGSAQVKQGDPVAQLVAVDDLDLPHIFNLRAGLDTADRDLDRRSVAVKAAHHMAKVNKRWVTFTPAGEAYPANSYYTGLFLGRPADYLASLKIKLVSRAAAKPVPYRLTITRLFIY